MFRTWQRCEGGSGFLSYFVLIVYPVREEREHLAGWAGVWRKMGWHNDDEMISHQ
jgi:hypothetical protein